MQSLSEKPLVLVVEDDADIADILMAYLDRDGMRSVAVVDGRTALELHNKLSPDLVLLDLRLPQLDGYAVLTKLRERGQTPVIIISANDDADTKLQLLHMGADDYVVKPFNGLEVVGRVRAVLRRANASMQSTVLRVQQLEIDLSSHLITVNHQGQNRILDLTLTEFRLLATMAHFPLRAFTRAELVNACFPESDSLERAIDSHASKLRQKLKLAGVDGFFESVRGVGYRLVHTL